MKKTKYKMWQPLHIRWVDSHHTSKWRTSREQIDDIDDDWLEHQSIGFFLHETAKSIAIIQSMSRDYDDEKDYRSTDAMMCIPKVSIRRITKINAKV